MHQQTVQLKDDPGTSEQLYAVVNRSTRVVEVRLPDMPNALTAIMRMQTLLNEARTNSSGMLEFYENPEV